MKLLDESGEDKISYADAKRHVDFQSQKYFSQLINALFLLTVGTLVSSINLVFNSKNPLVDLRILFFSWDLLVYSLLSQLLFLLF